MSYLMRYIPAFALLLLTACADNGPSLTAVQQACGYGSRPFEQSWPCVREGFTQHTSYGDLRAYYVSVGDVAYERVQAGQMTQAEARLALEEARQKVLQAGAQRQAGMPVRTGIVCTRVGYTTICN